MHENSVYMTIDLLGRIYIKDVIIYYDKPLTFSCINDFGQLFIASCIDIDYTEEWLFVPLTKARLILGLKGNIQAYKLFTEPEGDFIWKIKISSSTYHNGIATQISPTILTEDDLPDTDITYNIYDSNDFNIQKTCQNDLIQLSIDERREIFDISLEPSDTHIHEIDVTTLSKLLDQTQSIVNLIAYKKGINAKMPTKIKEDNKLKCTGNYAASFGIRLKSNNLANLMNESILQDNLTIFMELLDAKSNKELINEILKSLNPSVGIYYRNFLKFLSKEKISLKTYCAFPNNKYYSNSLSLKEIDDSIKTLENDIKQIELEKDFKGTLVAIDILKKTFKFVTDDGEKIHGAINNDIDIDEYILPKSALITLNILTKFDELVDRETSTYKLIKIHYE